MISDLLIPLTLKQKLSPGEETTYLSPTSLVAFGSKSFKPRLTIVDRPCGSGKSSKLLSSFRSDRKYLVVVPLLTEVDRFKKDACVRFTEPSSDYSDRKLGSLLDLLMDGENVVTTHALYADLAHAAYLDYLSDYDIVVDEVLDVVRQVDGATTASWKEIYVGGGWATVDADGKCRPTSKWDLCWKEVSDTLDQRLYMQAKAGCLYIVDDTFFLWAIPPVLLTSGRTFTVLTYLAEGSMLLAYLRKLGLSYIHDRDPEVDRQFRVKAQSLITVRPIPALENLKWSYTKQTASVGKALREKKVAKALSNLRQRELRGVDPGSIILTCVKSNWFLKGKSKGGEGFKPTPVGYSKGSSLFNVEWVANTTRGTNDYSHCSHAIYLWDQNLNPYLQRWLGIADNPLVNDAYAITEFVQWLWRTRVRRGEPVTVYVPSERMRHLLKAFLAGGEPDDFTIYED